MEKDLILMGSHALKKAAVNEEAKQYILNNEALFKTLKKAADRYIGGETLEETIPKVKLHNAKGFKCSVEFMGENTVTEKEANEATNEFINIVKQTNKHQLYSTVSLDLSHIGLAVSRELGLYNLKRICEEAQQGNIEVIISAEGVEATDAVIDTYKSCVKVYDNVGITLQAYLYRTEDDFKDLVTEKGRIRIVKGAFDTPQELAMPRGKDLDNAYLNYIDQLLAINHKCSIATHHDFIQKEAEKLIQHHQADKRVYEFESLFGIQNEQLELLKDKGHPAKVYFVYGKEWYLYLCNRIAEYPLNLFRALNDILS
ncbi:proline dehydrogenase [marine bacterium AO1-C]|nr:proline dehydrogenase [marine bacterium AO1-C]